MALRINPGFRRPRPYVAALLLGAGLAGGALAAHAQLADLPANHWARPAVEQVVAKGLMSAPDGKFQPDRPVTRAELAVVLVKMIDAVEKGGPKPFDQSPARHDVPVTQLAALKRLPRSHRATPALTRLVKGGYLSPPEPKNEWLPSAATLDQPVTAREVANAVASVSLRLEEKKIAVERPEALQEGLRPETR